MRMPRSPLAFPLAIVAIVAAVTVVVTARQLFATTTTELRSTPSVVTAVRDLARLELNVSPGGRPVSVRIRGTDGWADLKGDRSSARRSATAQHARPQDPLLRSALPLAGRPARY